MKFAVPGTSRQRQWTSRERSGLEVESDVVRAGDKEQGVQKHVRNPALCCFLLHPMPLTRV